MEKLAYLLRGNGKRIDETTAIHSVLLNEVAAAMQQLGAYNIAINIADVTEQVRQQNDARIMGNMESIIAEVEFWMDCYKLRTDIEKLLSPHCDQLHGYLVTESVVQHSDRQWQDGERRPGITQLCVFDKGEKRKEENFFPL